ncbi:MAG: helix-turn-helix transcriptional regulator [Sphaerochaetaceae bacterium]|nr:helix-turn-helix transcriptional regulator [Sphaerochaetaceae bacterium]
MSLQEALKLLRFELGLTQEDLARKLNRAFVTVNRWENGKGFPSRSNAKTILDIARINHVSADCLAYLNEVLLPDVKRSYPATAYGFPDIDREFLFQLADGSDNLLYVVEAGSYQLLYANRKAEKEAARYLSEIGKITEERNLSKQVDKRCFHYFGNGNVPCEFCPLSKIDSSGCADLVYTLPNTIRKYRVHVKSTDMNGRPVYVVYSTDITQEDAERNALYQLTNDIPAGVGIYHVYMDGRIELAFMNNVLFEMIGEERGKAISRNGSSNICLVHPDDKGLLMAEIKNSIAEKRDVSIDMRIKMSENEYHMVHLDGKMIKKAKERFTYYCLFHEKD